MDVAESVAFARQSVLSTGQLMQHGHSRFSVARALESSDVIKVRPGWFIERETWEASLPETRAIMAAVAAQRSYENSPLFSHRTAAVLHGLPVWLNWLSPIPVRGSQARTRMRIHNDHRTVHLISPYNESAPRSDTPLAKHRFEVPTHHITNLHGFKVTSVERTLIDLARSERFEVALACADTYLSRHARTGRATNASVVQAWCERLLAFASRNEGGRGVRAIRALADLANPLADSPLESVSRLRFNQLGIDVEQQTLVVLPSGRRYYLDFLLSEQGYFGECDGNAKYLDPEVRGDRDAREVIIAERRRFNEISNTTSLRGIRWGTGEVASAQHFESWLGSSGIAVTRRATSQFGKATAHFLNQLP